MRTNYDDYKAAEAAAPVDTTGTLPLAVRTLQYIPAADRWLYNITMSGDFRLARLPLDHPSYLAYVDAIGKGEVQALPKGATPETLAEREREEKEKADLIAKEIAAATRRGEEQQAAQRREAEAKKRAYDDNQRELGRRGMLTDEDRRLLRADSSDTAA